MRLRLWIAASCVTLGLAGVAVAPAWAAEDILTVGRVLPRFDRLTPGVKLYLRYTVDKDGKRSTLDIWRREVRFETRDGRRQFEIAQRWDSVGTPAYTSLQDSWFDAGDFRPLTHTREVTRDGKTVRRSYRYLPDYIVTDPVPGGETPADVPSPEPAYNFETDMELFQTLPLARGYEANINFYDPGRDPPRRYRFKVAGEDRIRGADGRFIETWLVTADYNDPSRPPTRFWFAKSTQVMLREEAPLPDGRMLIKTLLTEEAP